MTAAQLTSHAYAEQFVPEDEVVEAARHAGTELGAPPIGTGGGAALRLLAAASRAQHVVEIGTGAGTSGLWLLSGMPADGVLTTIELEPENAARAKKSFARAGIVGQRTRVISGRALDVLPRMNDEAYDLVHIDADKEGYPAYVEHAIRLLRPGGVMAIDNMLWHDKVADPAVRDTTTSLLRDLGKQLRDDERLVASLLPVGDGMLAAVKRHTGAHGR
ncbi:O-methyltransferase [Janibacter cremeus]|uniref:Putative O-methyltransferase YrrM n=1 Tax=Janibacter cremeus TaxID=1285192 RepID=A0A852VNK1_9MICO|nr:O-methyltransferase [Janibacter cremeus]NYF97509.1 putative O-methyltransferase YrrM [Janibacter cremeus]